MKNLFNSKSIILFIAVLFISSFSFSQNCPTSHTVQELGNNKIDITFNEIPFTVDSVFIDTIGNGVLDWVGTSISNEKFRFNLSSGSVPFIYDITFGTPTSGYMNCSYSQSLPVELIYFNAYLDNRNKIVMSWKTASESNNDGFQILQNGKIVGFVSGNGNTNLESQYRFIIEPLNGYNYIQLKQVDFDGKFEYSEIIVINYDSKLIDSGIEYDLLGRKSGALSNGLNIRFSRRKQTIIIKK